MTALVAAVLATLAFVRGGIAFTAAPDGTRPLAAGPAVGVAFGHDRTLYRARPAGRAGTCDLYRSGRSAPVLRFRDVRPRGVHVGLCELATRPQGGLAAIFSGRTYGLDLGSRSARLLAPGRDPAFEPNGRSLVVVRGGVLQRGVPGVPASFRAITPSAPGLSYRHPAFSPRGAFLASARCARTCLVVLGRAGGTLRPVWRPQSRGPVSVRGLGWLDDSTLLLELARPGAAAGNLFSLQIGSHLLQRIATGITSFAIA